MIIGTGIDIIEIERIQKAIDRWGNSFLEHVFTPKEIAYAKKYAASAQHFAARFAAKEAVYKAISTNPTIRWKDIEITNDENGKPCCTVHVPNFAGNILLSISHTHTYAVANAIITREPERS